MNKKLLALSLAVAGGLALGACGTAEGSAPIEEKTPIVAPVEEVLVEEEIQLSDEELQAWALDYLIETTNGHYAWQVEPELSIGTSTAFVGTMETTASSVVDLLLTGDRLGVVTWDIFVNSLAESSASLAASGFNNSLVLENHLNPDNFILIIMNGNVSFNFADEL